MRYEKIIVRCKKLVDLLIVTVFITAPKHLANGTETIMNQLTSEIALDHHSSLHVPSRNI